MTVLLDDTVNAGLSTPLGAAFGDFGSSGSLKDGVRPPCSGAQGGLSPPCGALAHFPVVGRRCSSLLPPAPSIPQKRRSGSGARKVGERNRAPSASFSSVSTAGGLGCLSTSAALL